mmetsp:Transcript_18679/g.46656  ORF Transcript_18679/g.46656 Transcript_18679/m.46656 type:complete len:201 (+) Transcript_18679:386-988(+)|eukprot:CAMPEP_0179000028 /NCGR_PEP_ID=MMETSP0795-20121207/10426_1 /TAXON_ID=88552 /ORGANISM="Amoebophrya sp., Strain Ameob2" /LENGTH=200 /DNA_ID=CAMNT_0020692943 /DNA_START=321 /DNA_END=923 /DNA_ORIENTATION=+
MAQEENRKLCQAAHKGLMDGETGVKFFTSELLRRQGDLDFSEKPYYRTAFHEAISMNREPIAKFLLDKNVSMNCTDYLGRTPLHDASYYGYQSLVDLLLERKAEIKQDDEGRTPLFRAVEAQRWQIAKTLIEKGCDANVTDKHGCTAYHMAAFKGLGTQSWWLYCKGAWKNRFALEDTVGEEEPAAAPPAEAAPVPAEGG